MNKEEKSMECKQDILNEEPISNEELSNQIDDFISTAISLLKPSSSMTNDTLWFNLIYVEISFSIESYLFQEEFLWDRKRKNPNEIKQFAIELIKEQVIDEKKCSLIKGINSFTFELLDRIYFVLLFDIVTAERVTKEILNDIYFYERFHPFDLIQSGFFGFGYDFNQNEHFIAIKININIKGECYEEDIKWNILDCTFSPEEFAIQTVKEMSLSEDFIKCISYEIRKQIKNYVFNLFEFVFKKYQLKSSEHLMKNIKLNKKTAKKQMNKKINNSFNYSIYLFDNKLSVLLGNKTKRDVNNNDDLPPIFNMKPISIENKQMSKTISQDKEIVIMSLNKKAKIEVQKETNSNIIYYDSNIITINKSLFIKEESKLFNFNEVNDNDLMYQKEERESNSNRSQLETKSTSPKAKQLILKGILSDEVVTFTKCLN